MNWSTFKTKGTNKIIIKPISATLTKVEDIDTQAHIHCKVTIDSQEQKTSDSYSTGKQLSWDDPLEFTVTKEDAQVYVSLESKDDWHENEGFCDAWIPIFDNKKGPQVYSLFSKGDEVGRIVIEIELGD